MLNRIPSRRLIPALVLTALPAGLGAQHPDSTGPEPTVWGTVEYFGTAVLTDGWAVVTAPLKWDRDDALLFGGVMAVGGILAVFDEPIHEELLRSRGDAGFRQTEDLALAVEPFALMSQTNKYYAAGLVVANVLDHTTGVDRPRHILEELLISHWVGALTRKTLGRAVGRFRPDEGRGAYHFEFWDATSFPSGHVSTATQVAAVLSHHIDRWPATVLLYGAAAAVGYERIVSSNHWASDVWIGALWGWAVSQVVIRRREADRQDWVPLLEPEHVREAAGYRVGIRIPVGF